jgi:hypothetical protein
MTDRSLMQDVSPVSEGRLSSSLSFGNLDFRLLLEMSLNLLLETSLNAIVAVKHRGEIGLVSGQSSYHGFVLTDNRCHRGDA